MPGLLQQTTPTQLRRIDVAHPIRETRCRPTGRSIRKAFTIRGEAHYESNEGITSGHVYKFVEGGVVVIGDVLLTW